LGFIIPLEEFSYPSKGFIIPLEGFRYPSWGVIIPLEGFSEVKMWFNRLAREVLTGEDLPVSESSVATGNTEDIQVYPVMILDRK